MISVQFQDFYSDPSRQEKTYLLGLPYYKAKQTMPDYGHMCNAPELFYYLRNN